MATGGSGQVIPSRVSTVAMWVLLGSLGMLFFAGMLAYLMIRLNLTRLGVEEQPVANAPKPLVAVHLSHIFLLSTLVVMMGSVTIHRAVAAVRRERVALMKRWVAATLGLAVLFCCLQYPGLADLWRQHVPRTEVGANLSRLILVLIIVHALHVLGGVAYLAVVEKRARAGRYDHEHYVGVRHAAMYWHFLDGVWIVMFSTMLLLG